MFIIVWLILFSILLWIVLVVSYWEKLIRSKDTYTREELVYFHKIYDIQLRKMNPNHSILGYIAFLTGILIAWCLTLLGGLISPDSGPEPDFASNEMANYFFQSGLFVFMLHLVWPSLRFYFEEHFAPDFILDFMNHDKSFFTGLSVTLPSISLTCWGMYHQISFLFVLINGIILLTYASYQILRNPLKENLLENYPDNDRNNADNKEEELEI
ncbi:MAG: hypothetical protein KatS3mg129_0772 [Leptospiraceae bacterium]|nr:MAG: hypothetical protein KatS3mg129_0772 [Leptospiraceae bacterium]